MESEITLTVRFEAAHLLPNVPEGHKCRRLHGHSYVIDLEAVGEVVEPEGWVLDFDDIYQAWLPLEKMLDHYYLNEVVGLDNPTSENLAKWVWDRMRENIPQLSSVTVRETCVAKCTYRGR